MFPRPLDWFLGTERQEKETAGSLILSGIETHASIRTITHYFQGLAWLGLITENVLPVCIILCDLLPKASVNDLDSSLNGKFLKVKQCILLHDSANLI